MSTQETDKIMRYIVRIVSFETTRYTYIKNKKGHITSHKDGAKKFKSKKKAIKSLSKVSNRNYPAFETARIMSVVTTDIEDLVIEDQYFIERDLRTSVNDSLPATDTKKIIAWSLEYSSDVYLVNFNTRDAYFFNSELGRLDSITHWIYVEDLNNIIGANSNEPRI